MFSWKKCHRISEISCFPSIKPKLLYSVWDGIPCIRKFVNSFYFSFPHSHYGGYGQYGYSYGKPTVKPETEQKG